MAVVSLPLVLQTEIFPPTKAAIMNVRSSCEDVRSSLRTHSSTSAFARFDTHARGGDLDVTTSTALAITALDE
jgi:hypothetical protein